MIANQFYCLLPREIRETAFKLPFSRKIDSTMGFQSTFAPSLTLPDRSTPLESDSESVTSAILTKNQLKRSKNDQVRLINNNNGYHLVSSSSSTQPKMTSVITAPPHLPRYCHLIISIDPPGRYNKEENNPPPKPPVRISTKHPQSMPSTPKKNDDVEKEVSTPPPTRSITTLILQEH